MISDEYAAGLFDGEGSVILNAGDYECMTLCCTMHLTHHPAISALHSRFGGSLNTVKRLQPSTLRPMWSWRVSGAAAAAFLRCVRPHLIIKSQQADLGLEFQWSKKSIRSLGGCERSGEVHRRQEFKRRMQELNAG